MNHMTKTEEDNLLLRNDDVLLHMKHVIYIKNVFFCEKTIIIM